MKNLFNKFFSLLQKLGQSLMVPVSVLPAAGLLVALGRLLTEQNKIAGFKIIGEVAFSGGIAIFEHLPTLFAVGVAIGFSGGAAISGLAAVAGYFTLINVLKTISTHEGLTLSLNTGVFGGIMVGLMASAIYQKFHQTKLPPFLGFFSGKRIVPIITALCSLLLGLVLSMIWPFVQQSINDFGHYILGSSFGPPVYASIKRLLIPVGLHHVFYPPFLYEFGEYINATGEVFRGEAARYYAGDPSAGVFMGSEYAMMLFGLPAAALAIYLKAHKNQKKTIGGVMLAGALTAIITGISEPIEFSFIFVAPILFFYHVALTFFSAFLASSLDIHLGYTFSASLIDLTLGAFNQKNLSLFLFLVGPLTALFYFCSFYFTIGWLNLKTPGRESESSNESSFENHTQFYHPNEKVRQILKALGGAENIRHIDACITRLRLSVHDSLKVQIDDLKMLGAMGVVNAGGGNIQVIFGTSSDMLKDEIKKIINTPTDMDEFHIGGPLKGEITPLSLVPDKMFSQNMMGKGIAIHPTENIVYAPCTGVIATIFRTNHAIGILADNGAELLIHVGIDTVKMNGEGFKSFVKAGDRVNIGDKLIEFDLELVKLKSTSPLTPMVVTNSSELKEVNLLKDKGLSSINIPLIQIRK